MQIRGSQKGTAQLEGNVTNGRMQEITGEHSKDITGALQNLVRDGLLTQQNQRRWVCNRVAEDFPQSSPQLDRLAGLSSEMQGLLPLSEPARKTKKLPLFDGDGEGRCFGIALPPRPQSVRSGVSGGFEIAIKKVVYCAYSKWSTALFLS